MGREHRRSFCDHRDRREVFQRIVRYLARVESRVDAECRRRAHQQCVAVRRSLGDDVGADDSVRAGPVIDDHGLPERFGQLLCDEARVLIERPTRGDGHDQAHRPLGILLRVRVMRRKRDQREGCGDKLQHSLFDSAAS
jgi:hypothetical protein